MRSDFRWNGRAVSAVPLVVAALPDEDEAITSWKLKRDGARRGIVEVRKA